MARSPDLRQATILHMCRAFMEAVTPHIIQTARVLAARLSARTVAMIRTISARVLPRHLAIHLTIIETMASATPAVSRSVQATIGHTAQATLAGIGTAWDTAPDIDVGIESSWR
jgi:hypothetical protein